MSSFDKFLGFVPFILVFIFIVWINKRGQIKAKVASIEMGKLLEQLRNEVISVSGSSVPGREIKRVIGMVRGVSDTQATGKEKFELAEKEALYNMLMQAKSLGANAVIDVNLCTGTYQQTGSKWQVSQAVYNGTAVVL